MSLSALGLSGVLQLADLLPALNFEETSRQLESLGLDAFAHLPVPSGPAEEGVDRPDVACDRDSCRFPGVTALTKGAKRAANKPDSNSNGGIWGG